MATTWPRSAFALGLLLLGAGCADERAAERDASGDSPRTGGTVVVAAPQEPEAATVFAAQNRYTQELLRYALFLPLVQYGPQLELEPALAFAWELTADTGVVFELRDDVYWHDGVRTTAFDVKFTFDRAKDPDAAFPLAGDFLHWTSAEVLDMFRVRFRWTPHGDPLSGLPFLPIMPRHLLDSVPAADMGRAAFNRRPVGNGPFRFLEQRANDRWVFEANAEFPQALGGRPRIDRLIWRVIPDNTAQLAELRTGNADLVLNPRAEGFAAHSADPRLRGIVREDFQYAFVGWNGRRAPFGDARVRRALTLAMDRQKMIDVLRDGRGTIAVGPIGPGHWAFADTIPPLPLDTAAAQRLLAEAGIRDRNGDGRLELENGRPFAFALLYPAAHAFSRDMTQLIQADLAAIGVQVTPAPLEQNALVGRITSAARDYDAVLMGWNAGFRLSLRDLFHSAARAGPFQIAGYAHPVVDSLLDGTARLVDREQARPLYHRLLAILRDEVPWSFLYFYPDLYVASARLRGADMDIRGAFVNLPRWWVADAPQ